MKAVRFALRLALGVAPIACATAGCSSSDDLLSEARARVRAGQFDAALPLVRKVLAKDVDRSRANLLLARTLVGLGKPALAVWPLERASHHAATGLEASLALARIHLAHGNYRDGARAAERALAIDPRSRPALELLGSAQMGSRSFEAALRAAERLTELSPESTDAVLLRAAALAQLGRTKEAEAGYESLLARGGEVRLQARVAQFLLRRDTPDPEGADDALETLLTEYADRPMVTRLGLAYYDAGRRGEEAITLLRRAIAAQPDATDLRVEMAKRLARAGREEEAEEVLQDGVQRSGTPESFYALADHLARAGRLNDALAWLDRGLLDSDAEILRFRRGEVLVAMGRRAEAARIATTLGDPLDTQLLLGLVSIESGDPAGALEHLDVAVRLWPNNARARLLAGRAAFEAGDLERAESEWREAHRADPELGEAVVSLTSLLVSQERYREALAFAARHPEPTDPEILLFGARAARALAGPDAAARLVQRSGADLTDSRYTAVLRTLARDLVDAGRSAEGAALLENACARAPKDAALRYQLAGALVAAGRKREAQTALREVIALDPDDAAARNNLAWLLAESGRDLDQALALAREARALDESAEVLDTLGWVRLRRGELDRAERAFRQALARNPVFPEAAYHLALALERAGDTRGARSAAERALALGHFSDEAAARRLRERLAPDAGG